MATESHETSSEDERDEAASPGGESEEASQEELAEKARKDYEQQLKESKHKAGPIAIAIVCTVGAIGLILIYLGSTTQGSHPLVSNGLMVLGLVNLGLALASFVRANWSRTSVLVAMAVDIVAVLLSITLTSTPKYLVLVLPVVVYYLLFRQPILDEYDAPKE